jgi:hypothetical protein
MQHHESCSVYASPYPDSYRDPLPGERDFKRRMTMYIASPSPSGEGDKRGEARIDCFRSESVVGGRIFFVN